MIVKKGKSQVTFVFCPEAACTRVDLAGTFNDWQPGQHKMTRQKDGSFRKRLNLGPGEHRYKFLVDGNWVEDHEAERQAPNPFGTSDSVLTVG